MNRINDIANQTKSRIFLWVSVLLTCMALQVKAQTFTDVGVTDFEALTNAQAYWVDFDNDGLLDLFVAGTNSGGTFKNVVYLNNGDDTFNTINLGALNDVAVDFGDFNNDTYIDLVITGVDAASDKKFIVYRNNNGTAFVAESFTFTDLSRGGLIWSDLDQDTDLDLVATGLDQSGDEQTLLYTFDGSDYTSQSHSMTALSNGQAKVLDGDNDQNPEILITGLDAFGQPQTLIYSTDNNLTITSYASQTGTAFNYIDLGDWNEDGFIDLAITGSEGSGLADASNYYTNNQVNGFIEQTALMVDVASSSVEYADLNNDGLLDLTITGIDDLGTKYFNYHVNSTPSYAFDTTAIAVENIYDGDAAFGDYDNDGDLDLFQVGNSDLTFQANLYESDMQATTVNAAPATPANLTAVVTEDSVYLSWDEAADDLTDASSLTYAIYLSESASATDLVVSPLSNIGTGYRKIHKSGNAGFNEFKSFHNLPEGRYYWSVQTIDNGYKGSSFATEQSFAVCYSFSLGNDTAICYNESIALSAGEPGDEVNWSSLTDGDLLLDNNDLNYTVTKLDTLVAEVIKPYSCTVTDTIIIDVNDLPTIDLGSDYSVCFEDMTTLLATGYDSVNWYATSNGSTAVLQDADSYSYQVTVRDTVIAEVFNSNGCVNYDSIVVDVITDLPSFDLGDDYSVCEGESTTLSVTDLGISNLDSVNWYTANGATLALADSEDYTYTVDETDTLVAEVYNTSGCLGYDTIIVDVFDLPSFSLGNDTSVCNLESISFSVSDLGITGLDSANWYTVNSGNTPVLANAFDFTHEVLEDDFIVAEVFNSNGCVNRDTIEVLRYELPAFDIGADTAVCFEEFILLQTDQGFQEVNWYSQATGDTLLEDSWFYNYQVLTTDTLIAEVFNFNNCVNYDTIIIEMLALPDFTVGPDQYICEGDSITLDVGDGWDEVNWFTTGSQLLEGNSSTYRFQVVEDLTIWAEVYNANRCVYYDTVEIFKLDLPSFDLGDDRTYCDGDSVIFDLEVPGNTYEWRNASGVLANTLDFAYIADVSDELFLTIQSDSACVFADSINVTVNELPVFSISGDDEICANDTATLLTTFTAWEAINWYDANDTLAVNSNQFELSTDQTTEIFLELTDENSCVNYDSITVLVNPRPTAQAGVDTLLCFGETLELGAGTVAGETYAWSPATYLSATDVSNPTTSPEASIVYVLEVTTGAGCNSFDTVQVDVNPEITVDAGDNLEVCIGSSVTIGGNPTATGSDFGYQYEWTPNNNISSTSEANPSVFPEVTTTYHLAVQSGRCAIERDSIVVTVNSLPEIEVSPMQSVGSGGTVPLMATGGVAYEWSPPETLDDPFSSTPEASPLVETTYQVAVTDANGCVSIGEVTVLVQSVLFVPNLFTPNGDGNNDEFKVFGSGVENIRLTIFDKEGNQVFQATTVSGAMEVGWDGTRNGQQLKSDIYLWTMEGNFYNGSKLKFDGKSNGIIKLVR